MDEEDFSIEDLKEIKKNKKNFHKNEVLAVEKYIAKIRTQSLKSNKLLWTKRN